MTFPDRFRWLRRAAPLLVAAALAAPLAASAAPEFLNGSGAGPGGDLPFSEAVRAGGVLYLSGVIGVRPGTMTLVPGGVKAEAAQALANIRTVLEANGRSLKDVIRCTVMLADIAEWPAFNEVYRTVFTKPFPARSAFAASGLALGARVEIECTASAGP